MGKNDEVVLDLLMKKMIVVGLSIILGLIMAAVLLNYLLHKAKEDNFDRNIEYYIISSNMLDKSGALIGIDVNGDFVSKKEMKIQDVTKFNYNNNIFIAGGVRSNNNLIIKADGSYERFFLLDNPNYSGVTSINIQNEEIIAVMNGNVEGDTYQNLFVAQDINGKMIQKKIIDIYSSDLCYEDDTVYIVGSYLSVKNDTWSSKIIKIDKNNLELEEKIFDKNTEYRSVLISADKIYCLGISTKDQRGSIDILDKRTLKRLDSLNYSSEISAIFTVNDSLFGVVNNEICEIKDGVLLSSEYTLPENTYVSSYLGDNKSVHIYSRNDVIYEENGKAHMGYIIKYNGKKDEAKKFSVLMEGRRYDHIIFFPVEYLK